MTGGRPAVGTDVPPIAIRPVEAEDDEELGKLFDRLSAETIYLRFFHPVKRPDGSVLRHFSSVDHRDREAIAAVAGERIVGVARYDRDADNPTQAEMAILVEDEWQSHGVGILLLNRLADRALAAGVTTFTATVLGENTRMLGLARKLAPHAEVRLEHGEWELTLPLAS